MEQLLKFQLANDLIERHDGVEKTVDMLLPDTSIQLTPINQLKPYQRSVNVLMLLLVAFGIPIVTLLVVFVVMVVELSIEQRGNETPRLQR